MFVFSEKNYFGSHKFKSVGRPGVKRFSKNDESAGGRHSRRGKEEESSGGKRKMNFGDRNMAKRVKSSSSGKESAGGAKNAKKRFNLGLKNNDQIMKERNRKEKIKQFQGRKHQGGGKHGKTYKPKFR